MKQYAGKCQGGPHHGQYLAHWQKRKTLYRPMSPFTPWVREPAVLPIEIGEYVLSDFDVWHWHESEAGRAYRTLFGSAA